MNIFALSNDARVAAAWHCDKHIRKMVIEYAQLLSTAHRVLDGQRVVLKVNNRKRQVYLLSGELALVTFDEKQQKEKVTVLRKKCYLSTHVNHPSAKWARKTRQNYFWLLELLKYCVAEYEIRFGKQHAVSRELEFLSSAPLNIPSGELTEFALAMPKQYWNDDAVIAYQTFYREEKARFATWKNRPTPDWFTAASEGTSEGTTAAARDEKRYRAEGGLVSPAPKLSQ